MDVSRWHSSKPLPAATSSIQQASLTPRGRASTRPAPHTCIRITLVGPAHAAWSAIGKLGGCPPQRVAARDGGPTGTCHVQIWHERERDVGKLLGSQVGMLADRGEDTGAEA